MKSWFLIFILMLVMTHVHGMESQARINWYQITAKRNVLHMVLDYLDVTDLTEMTLLDKAMQEDKLYGYFNAKILPFQQYPCLIKPHVEFTVEEIDRKLNLLVQKNNHISEKERILVDLYSSLPTTFSYYTKLILPDDYDGNLQDLVENTPKVVQAVSIIVTFMFYYRSLQKFWYFSMLQARVLENIFTNAEVYVTNEDSVICLRSSVTVYELRELNLHDVKEYKLYHSIKKRKLIKANQNHTMEELLNTEDNMLMLNNDFEFIVPFFFLQHLVFGNKNLENLLFRIDQLIAIIYRHQQTYLVFTRPCQTIIEELYITTLEKDGQNVQHMVAYKYYGGSIDFYIKTWLKNIGVKVD